MIFKNSKKIIENKKGVKKNSVNNKRGFVILIAIVVSGLLVSMGIFIANIAYKELILSTSTKASQKAFFVADSVIECALRHDIRGAGFRINGSDTRTKAELAILCNGNTFIEENGGVANFAPEVSSDSDEATSVYFISFASDVANVGTYPNAAYAKLIVKKYKIGTVDDLTIIKVFGHNKYSGAGQVERAIEVSY